MFAFKNNNTDKFKIGDRVRCISPFLNKDVGIVTELYKNTKYAIDHNLTHLDKFHIIWDNGNSSWLYGCDLEKI